MTNHPDQLTRKIQILDNPERQISDPAENLLQLIAIKESANILDVGAGTGYLTIPVAKQTKGTVYALDLDKGILDYLDTKAKNAGLDNVQQVEGNFTDIPLKDLSIDVALASLSLHEVTPLSDALQQINRVLKPEGIFLCVEIEPKEDAKGPRVNSLTMEKELLNAGFTIKEKVNLQATFFEEDLYVMIARKN